MSHTETRDDKPSQLMSVRDVSLFLQISERSVWRRVFDKSFPEPIHVGRLARWRPDDVEAWILKGGK